MILLDTNVISEWMKSSPDPRVIAWLDDMPESQLFLPSVAKAEIELGVALLPDGKRKTALRKAAEAIFEEFSSRCLPLDCDASAEYAAIISFAKRIGRPMSVEDAQIAAIARRNSLKLSTRNVSDFNFLDNLDLINPWQRGVSD